LTIPVELGGGPRTADDVAAIFDAGIGRVILGTVAIERPSLMAELLACYGPERILLGLDARDGQVATRGWLTTSQTSAETLAIEMAALGLRTVIHTDIGRDGTLTGPNITSSSALAAASGLAVIASGGVSRRADLIGLAAAPGITGVIVGKALYTGSLQLSAGEWLWPSAGADDREQHGDAQR
jgi:phosphoribosylformimino-5-aminoimidazole carboxamide ribotide isomerase